MKNLNNFQKAVLIFTLVFFVGVNLIIIALSFPLINLAGISESTNAITVLYLDGLQKSFSYNDYITVLPESQIFINENDIVAYTKSQAKFTFSKENYLLIQEGVVYIENVNPFFITLPCNNLKIENGSKIIYNSVQKNLIALNADFNNKSGVKNKIIKCSDNTIVEEDLDRRFLTVDSNINSLVLFLNSKNLLPEELLDLTPPEIALVNRQDLLTQSESVEIVVNTEPGLEVIFGEFITKSNEFGDAFFTTNLLPGSNKVSIKITDDSGNFSTALYNFFRVV